MKKTIAALFIFAGVHSFSQELNSTFNRNTEYGSSKKNSIEVNGNLLQIRAKVIYNALPDGYHITYTYTSISKSIEDLEELTFKKKEKLSKAIKKVKLKEEDMVIDVIALDPIFSMNTDTSNMPKPTGFKSTHNVTFNINDIGKVDDLSRLCFQENIYDIIDITPYINLTKHIEDSLSNKSIEVLNQKKKLARDIGFEIVDGKASFQKKKNTIYPSERYLKSYINNSSVYKHHISQNANINYNRKVDIDSYYNFDLRDADVVFHSKEVKPVIQFIYEINYGFLKRDREQEARDKEEQERLEKRRKDIYILDEKGKMKKVAF